jgi:predicted nucleic acid-binding protein
MILVDTSVLFAFFDPNDSCHTLARKLFLELPKNQILILEDVLKELLTVVNLRKGSDVSKIIYNELNNDDREVMLYNFTSLEFFDFINNFQTIKNTKLSLIDLELLYLSTKNNIPVLTFDKNLNKSLPDSLIYNP